MVYKVSLKFESYDCDFLNLLQNNSECEVTIVGRDGECVRSNNIMLVSVLVRSSLNHQKNLRDNVLLLPDFTSQDIKEALSVLETKQKVDIIFNRTTKNLLETLGVPLDNIQQVEISAEKQKEYKSGDPFQRLYLKFCFT